MNARHQHDLARLNGRRTASFEFEVSREYEIRSAFMLDVDARPRRAAAVALSLVFALIGVMVAAAAFAGCATDAAVKRQVGTAAAVAEASILEWNTLTPEEQYATFWRFCRLPCDLDYALNGRPIPAAFEKGRAPVIRKRLASDVVTPAVESPR